MSKSCVVLLRIIGSVALYSSSLLLLYAGGPPSALCSRERSLNGLGDKQSQVR